METLEFLLELCFFRAFFAVFGILQVLFPCGHRTILQFLLELCVHHCSMSPMSCACALPSGYRLIRHDNYSFKELKRKQQLKSRREKSQILCECLPFLLEFLNQKIRNQLRKRTGKWNILFEWVLCNLQLEYKFCCVQEAPTHKQEKGQSLFGSCFHLEFVSWTLRFIWVPCLEGTSVPWKLSEVPYLEGASVPWGLSGVPCLEGIVQSALSNHRIPQGWVEFPAWNVHVYPEGLVEFPVCHFLQLIDTISLNKSQKNSWFPSENKLIKDNN